MLPLFLLVLNTSCSSNIYCPAFSEHANSTASMSKFSKDLPPQRKRPRKYHWGINDRLNSMTDSKTGETHYRYDRRGYLTQTRYADGIQEHRIPEKADNLHQTPDQIKKTERMPMAEGS